MRSVMTRGRDPRPPYREPCTRGRPCGWRIARDTASRRPSRARTQLRFTHEPDDVLSEPIHVSRGSQESRLLINQHLLHAGNGECSDGNACHPGLDEGGRHPFHPVAATCEEGHIDCGQNVGDVAAASEQPHPLPKPELFDPSLDRGPLVAVPEEQVHGVRYSREHPARHFDVRQRILLPRQRSDREDDRRRSRQLKNFAHRDPPAAGSEATRVDRVWDRHHFVRRKAEPPNDLRANGIRHSDDLRRPSHERAVSPSPWTSVQPTRRRPDPPIDDRGHAVTDPQARCEHRILQGFPTVSLNHVGIQGIDRSREPSDDGAVCIETWDADVCQESDVRQGSFLYQRPIHSAAGRPRSGRRRDPTERASGPWRTSRHRDVEASQGHAEPSRSEPPSESSRSFRWVCC